MHGGSLNFENGRPIARIDTGKYAGQIIYVNSQMQEKGSNYEKIDLRQNKLEPILDPENRTVTYIAGMSGSGKSTYAAGLAKIFHKLHPKKDIYFFGRKSIDEDDAFKNIVKSIKQVPIDNVLAMNPVQLEDIESGSLVIFDDVSTIYEKAQKDAVFKLMEDLMEVGRARKIDVIITSHLITPNDRKFGRIILNEMQTLTLFGKTGAKYQIEYVLEKYFGLTKKQINDILKLDSRWFTLYKQAPLVVLYEHGAYLLQ